MKKIILFLLMLIIPGRCVRAQDDTLTTASQRELLFVSHVSRNHVSVIDPVTSRVVGRIPAGTRTMSVAVSPSEKVGYIANWSSGDVTVFGQQTGKTLRTVSAGQNPCFLTLTRDGRFLIISHQSEDGLWFMDTKTDSIVKKLSEGTGPFCRSRSGDLIYEPQIFTPYVGVIDPSTLSIIKKIYVGGRPMAAGLTPDERYLYVVNYDLQELQKIDLVSDSVVGVIPRVKNGRDMALSPDGNTAYVIDVVNSRLSIINLVTSKIEKVVPVGSMPVSVTLDADGRTVYIACESGSSISVIDAQKRVKVRSIPVDWNPINVVCMSAYSPRLDHLSAITAIATHPLDSLNAILIDNLCRKKVVMIGDGYHEHGSYMRIVTGLLNYWADALATERKGGPLPDGLDKKNLIPHKLILFLESDSESIALQLGSARNGDAAPWIAKLLQLETEWGHLIGGTSVDNLEYAYELNQVLERIASLNSKEASPQYDLQIVSPEGIPPYKPFDRGWSRDTAEFRKKYREFQRTKFNWFAHERDQISSKKVWEVLREHPDHKGVIFYGGAHLSRERQNKADVGGREFGIDTAYDYYLGHFLDKYFGFDSVGIFLTESKPAKDETGIVENAHTGELPDYDVSINLIPREPSPMELLPSRTVLSAFRQLIKQCVNEGNEHGRMFGRVYSARLYAQLLRSNLSNEKKTQVLLDTIRAHLRDTSALVSLKRDILFDSLIGAYDGISSIDSLQGWIAMGAIDSSLYNEMLNLVLVNTPGSDSVYQFENPMHLPLDSATQTFVHTHNEDLIEYFLVNLLWLGTPDERTRAVAKLISMTGQNYHTAEEWNVWWRKERYH